MSFSWLLYCWWLNVRAQFSILVHNLLSSNWFCSVFNRNGSDCWWGWRVPGCVQHWQYESIKISFILYFATVLLLFTGRYVPVESITLEINKKIGKITKQVKSSSYLQYVRQLNTRIIHMLQILNFTQRHLAVFYFRHQPRSFIHDLTIQRLTRIRTDHFILRIEHTRLCIFDTVLTYLR